MWRIQEGRVRNMEDTGRETVEGWKWRIQGGKGVEVEFTERNRNEGYREGERARYRRGYKE